MVFLCFILIGLRQKAGCGYVFFLEHILRRFLRRTANLLSRRLPFSPRLGV